ncbi:FMRFamide receptor, partial [Eurytemora carolleeae]|uniref:FMRFamide receptor n=1 Tax=Eurytemora carolleeae TaxID=1294199 RepID=UPI000C778D1C
MDLTQITYTNVTEVFSADSIEETMEEDLEECRVIPSLKTIQAWRFWLSGVFTLCTGLLGIAGNIVSLVILTKKLMRNVFTLLLSSLCVADLIFLVSNLVLAPSSLGYKPALLTSLAAFSEAGSHLGLALSIFLTVAVTLERYQSISDPLNYEARVVSRGRTNLVLIYLIPSILLSIVFNIPRLLSVSSLGTSLHTNQQLVRIYIFYQAVHPLSTTGLIPFLFLSILNWRINNKIPKISHVSSSSRRRTKDFNLARVCTILVLVFLVLNLPRLTVGLYEVSSIGTILRCYSNNLKYYTPTWQWCADSVARYLAVVNSSINFLIYCLAGSQFRSELKKTLGMCRGSQSSPVTNSFSLRSIRRRSSFSTGLNSSLNQSSRRNRIGVNCPKIKIW